LTSLKAVLNSWEGPQKLEGRPTCGGKVTKAWGGGPRAFRHKNDLGGYGWAALPFGEAG